jgi:hypothetical protein
MKTYYFEDHIKISDRKPVEGYVEAYNGENKIFEGHNLVVNAGRMLIKDYIMGKLYLFYGNSSDATTPGSTKEKFDKDKCCSTSDSKNNNITVTRSDSADGLVVSLSIVIEPIMG